VFVCSVKQNKQTTKKEKAYKHTRKETTKITKENSTEKHKWKRAECDHMKKKKAEKSAKQNPSGI
jgi:hypothetical protein